MLDLLLSAALLLYNHTTTDETCTLKLVANQSGVLDSHLTGTIAAVYCPVDAPAAAAAKLHRYAAADLAGVGAAPQHPVAQCPPRHAHNLPSPALVEIPHAPAPSSDLHLLCEHSAVAV